VFSERKLSETYEKYTTSDFFFFISLILFKRVYFQLSAIQSESGLAENPLVVSWLTPPVLAEPSRAEERCSDRETQLPKASLASEATRAGAGAGNDFESIVLMRLRQAEERKRLAQELEQDEVAS